MEYLVYFLIGVLIGDVVIRIRKALCRAYRGKADKKSMTYAMQNEDGTFRFVTEDELISEVVEHSNAEPYVPFTIGVKVDEEGGA